MFKDEIRAQFHGVVTFGFQRKAAIYRLIKHKLNSMEIHEFYPICRIIRSIIYFEEFAIWLRIPSLIGGK